MEHHGDDVCGGSCVDARQNSCTIPTVGNLCGGSFSFPPEPIGVKLLIADNKATSAMHPSSVLECYCDNVCTSTIQMS